MIIDMKCRNCGAISEQLVGVIQSPPACDACGSADLQRVWAPPVVAERVYTTHLSADEREYYHRNRVDIENLMAAGQEPELGHMTSTGVRSGEYGPIEFRPRSPKRVY